MKQRTGRFIGVVSALLLFLSAGATTNASAQGTGFTYQGRLQDSGTNANGNYDFQFTLWDALTGGTQQPQPTPVTVTKSGVAVANGVFTVQLDFGATAFPGADRWLETSVRLSGAGALTVLSPRQPITSTPYAVRSASSSSSDVATTATNATQLGGVAANQYVVTTDARMSDPRTPTAGSSNYIQNTASQQASTNFNISGNGTAGGTLSGNTINANTQYNIGGNRALGISGGGPFSNSNTFVGFQAGASNTPFTDGSQQGNFNSFFGKQAGLNNTSGFANTFFGSVAGGSNTTGPGNSFFGYDAGLLNTIGLGNSFFGASAGRANSLGSENSFFGNGTGTNSNGVQNSFYGAMAGLTNETGDSNSALGFAADFGSNNLSNATAIGAQAYVTASNSLVLGSISGFNAAAVDTNVGIGTTAPIARLHISGNASFANLLELENTNPGNARGFIVGPTANYFVIYDVNAATARLAINYGGNVGLGTTAPGAPLEVRRNAAIGADWQAGQLRISGASDPNMQLSVGYDTVNNLGVIQAGQANVAFRTLSFNPSGGNVGVGTTSPDQKLSVNGNASKSGGGSWLTFSDERLKNITGRFTPGLKAVMQLQPLRYEYKRDNALKLKSEGEHIGFSAQAVQKIIPEAVSKNDKGYLLVNNDPILWTMLNAIKEQQAEIDHQQELLKRQQEQIKRQEAQAREQRETFAAQQQQLDALKKLVCRSHPRSAACR
jgi:hypothetical protein